MQIGLIHDSRHVSFQIVMQISHVLYAGGQTLEKRQIAENRLVEKSILVFRIKYLIIILYILIAFDILTFYFVSYSFFT